MPQAKFFYPRISYGGGPTNIDPTEAAQLVRVSPATVGGVNIATGGPQETLTERAEYRVLLGFQFLDTATLTTLYTWWLNHARLGKQSALTLDRLATCAGQWEYDNFNAFFTKAVLVGSTFEPGRSFLARALYAHQLLFRQDT